MSNTAVGYKALEPDTIDLFGDHLYQNAFHILDARRTLIIFLINYYLNDKATRKVVILSCLDLTP